MSMEEPIFIRLADIDFDNEVEVEQLVSEIWKTCIERWGERK